MQEEIETKQQPTREQICYGKHTIKVGLEKTFPYEIICVCLREGQEKEDECVQQDAFILDQQSTVFDKYGTRASQR